MINSPRTPTNVNNGALPKSLPVTMTTDRRSTGTSFGKKSAICGRPGSGGGAGNGRMYLYPLSPLDSTDAAFGPTTNVRVNDTTETSSGTPLDMHSEAFNIRTGWAYIPTPEMRIRTDEGDGFLAVALIDVPSDSLTMSGTMYVEEL